MKFEEKCALRLLYLAASPRNTCRMDMFLGTLDASGRPYSDLIRSLNKQGVVQIDEGNKKIKFCKKTVIRALNGIDTSLSIH